MKKADEAIIKEYTTLKENGFTPEQIFAKAKQEGYKNFECIQILMIVYNITLDEARVVSHNFFKKSLKE